MSHIDELKDKDLEKVTGGITTEDCALGRVNINPSIIGHTADGVDVSITNYQGYLFDINGNEYRWSSFENSSDGLKTTYYFTSINGNNMYVKTITGNDNVFSLGVGDTNSYIIDNLGNVYASGNNKYGSMGNGTRKSKDEHSLVGERDFKVDKIADTMYVSDKEEIVISGNPFNVFDNKQLSNDEFNWSVENNDVIKVENGVVTALAEGTAYITIEDKITGESIRLTRAVIEPDQDRIKEIWVNNDKAVLDEESTADDIRYKCKVITDDDFGTLKVFTNNASDRINIFGEGDYGYNGALIKNIDTTRIKKELQQRKKELFNEISIIGQHTLVLYCVNNDLLALIDIFLGGADKLGYDYGLYSLIRVIICISLVVMLKNLYRSLKSKINNFSF